MLLRWWKMMDYDLNQWRLSSTLETSEAFNSSSSSRRFMLKHFRGRSVAIMAVVTVSLLVLPLVLPPLPPPPPMLLLLPVLIMGLLVLLAFSRTQVPGVAVASV